MAWTTVFEFDVEDRHVVGQVNSEGGYKIKAPSITDRPPGFEQNESQTMIGFAESAGEVYSVDAGTLAELRGYLVEWDFSEEAADNIVSHFEGYGE
jgi:hypothetical protein